MKRLHPSILGDLQPAVRLPQYQRDSLRPGIVHLGLGAFHRAHQAVFTDRAIGNSGGDWGIIGVSLRSTAVSRQLRPQDCLYSVMSEDGGGAELRVIGAIREVLVAPREPAAVAAAIARQDIKLLTLTITEKGYSLASDGRSLDRADPVVNRDLQDPGNPVSAVGLLALGLRRRCAAGAAPLTILSCDNLSENSKLLRGVLVDYLHSTFPEVLPWLEESATFPCSMVDRIVPAMTDAQQQRQAEALGLLDEGAVNTEPFSQWIIEDRFAAGRPDWESAGVQLVTDILPYENIKLRLLNASHSAIAYCGLLAGRGTVDEVMSDTQLRPFVEALMARELMPALDVPAEFDLAAYRDQLLARFSNPCLGHRCRQIAMDGSEKITQRWLPTLRDGHSPLLMQALSAWCYFVLRTDMVIEDPRAERLSALRAGAGPLEQRLVQVLDCARVSPQGLADFDALCAAIRRNMDIIAGQGVQALVAVSDDRA